MFVCFFVQLFFLFYTSFRNVLAFSIKLTPNESTWKWLTQMLYCQQFLFIYLTFFFHPSNEMFAISSEFALYVNVDDGIYINDMSSTSCKLQWAVVFRLCVLAFMACRCIYIYEWRYLLYLLLLLPLPWEIDVWCVHNRSVILRLDMKWSHIYERK